MKGRLGLRPVFHHRQDRIRAHLQLCWLALLLIRVIENTTGDTWRNIATSSTALHLINLSTGDGHLAQRTALTTGQKTIVTSPDLPEPPGSSTSPPLAPKRPHRSGARSNTTLTHPIGLCPGQRPDPGNRVLTNCGSPA